MHYLKLITDNWAIISPVVLLAASEYLSLNPNTKSSGLIQLAIGLMTKKPSSN